MNSTLKKSHPAMAPYARKNFETSKGSSQDVAAVRSASWLAVCHVSCWASSVILGAVSIWLRLQATQGVENSVFGIVGLGLWGSLPYVFAAIFAIQASKAKSYLKLKWFFTSSILSLICSIGILAFSSLAVAIEASIETSPKRVVVAGVLACFSLIEVITSVVSCISCYTSIGCFDKKRDKGERLKESGFPRPTRISPGDEDSGHVTVMALPARQAAELFYTMYRPFFPSVASHATNLQEAAAAAQEQAYSEPYDMDPPTTAEQRRRRHRRLPRPDPREYDPEPENSDEEVDFSRGHYHRSRRQGTPHRQFQDDDMGPDESVLPTKQPKLAPVLEDDQVQDETKNPSGEPAEKKAPKTDDSKPSKERGTKSKEQKPHKNEKQNGEVKETENKSGEKSS